MKALALSSLLASVLLAACSVSEAELPESTVAVNRCESAADCDGVPCQDGACVAQDTKLTSLLVQVTPPPTLPLFGGLAFYQVLDRQSSTGGRLNIDLGSVAEVQGHVDLHVDDPCRVAEGTMAGSIPVDVSFSPSERVLGIASSVYTASPLVSEDSERYEFSAKIPPGNYDVYIRPQPLNGCPTPPRLLLSQPITGSLAVNLAVPVKLVVDVYWPESAAGWKVSLLDDPTGRVISTEPLLEPVLSDVPVDGTHYQATLWYSDVEKPKASGMDARSGEAPDTDDEARVKVLKLTPPDGPDDPPRPTILSQLFAGKLAQKAPLPANVTVRGQTAIVGQAVPVEALLKITAETLVGFDSGIFASYSRTISVPETGLFDLQLPPGSYHVEATPIGASAGCSDAEPSEASPCLATASTTWEVGIAPDVQAGRLVEFPPATQVTGTARLWSGREPVGANVHMTASPSAPKASLIDASLGATQPSPRTAGGLVGERGHFSFNADPGFFDLIVQPDPSTRFGWYVFSGVELPIGASIGTITVPAPVAYSGTVRRGSTEKVTVPNALIRAYADSNGEPGGAVVQVAETWADEQGNFTLLIPRQLGPGPTRSSGPP